MSSSFKHIAVLKGGVSSEREVSLRSGAAVARGLADAGYIVEEIDVTERHPVLPKGIDAVFIALHGTYGEDGQIQAELDDQGLPYTGAGAMASSLAFDKIRSKKRMAEQGIPTPASVIIHSDDIPDMDFPLVIKPPREGSSVGLHIVQSPVDWADAVKDSFKIDSELLIESFVSGVELTVGIVGDDILPAIEIRPHSGVYDYRSKYTQGCTDYIIPAEIPADAAALAGEVAMACFEALGCRGFGRVDMIYCPEKGLQVLELNTLPGFTETSLLPKAAAAHGLNFSTLCDRIISLARLG
jgi:D-alanine-D-alanine ligase